MVRYHVGMSDGQDHESYTDDQDHESYEVDPEWNEDLDYERRHDK